MLNRGRLVSGEAGQHGREQLLGFMIRNLFDPGADVSVIVRRLATWPDVGAAVHAVTTAASLEALAQVEPPARPAQPALPSDSGHAPVRYRRPR